MRAAKYTQEDNHHFIRVIEEHAPLVKRIAHHLKARLPASVQADDLIQAGMMGLIDAAKNFNDQKGASFTTYAGIRIRGSMLDEIRRGDWAPRSVHKYTRMIQEAQRKVENETGREPKDEYHQIIRDTSTKKIFSFEDIGISQDMIGNQSAHTTKGPYEGLQQADIKQKVAQEIAKLPEREKLILALYYDEELNLREVGEVLGVSESRISQLHSQAVIRLKTRLQQFKG